MVRAPSTGSWHEIPGMSCKDYIVISSLAPDVGPVLRSWRFVFELVQLPILVMLTLAYGFSRGLA